MSAYAILNDANEVVAVDDVREWAAWFELNEGRRIVAQTSISPGVRVSTVFLGINHSFIWGGRPLWFETMIFGGPHSDDQQRYETYLEAQLGHQEMVMRAKQPTLQ